MSKHDTNDIVAKYVELRDARSRLKKEFTEQDDKLKAAQEVIQTYLMSLMGELGVNSLNADAGTAYRSTSTKASIADRHMVRNTVLATGNLDLLEMRASSAAVKQYMEEHDGAVPPGFSVFTEETVNIRRSN